VGFAAASLTNAARSLPPCRAVDGKAAKNMPAANVIIIDPWINRCLILFILPFAVQNIEELDTELQAPVARRRKPGETQD